MSTVRKPCIVFQTDFGLGGGCAMYGVCKQVDPELEPYELTHTIPVFDVEKASVSLRNTVCSWPEGTVFVSVVDPGVGTARRASVAKTANGYYIVTPDNGTLTYPLRDFGITEIRQIDETVNRYHGTEDTNIFHGRDLFAYCAARLAAGIITYEQVGPAYPVEEIVQFPVAPFSVEAGRAEGTVTSALIPFGNLDLSIPVSAFEKSDIRDGDRVTVAIRRGDEVKYTGTLIYYRCFAGAALGEEILFNNYSEFLGIAINRGNFAGTYQISSGPDWTVSIRKAAET